MQKTIEFYFDTVSPFSYLAWYAIHNEISKIDDNIKIKYLPIFLIRIFKAHGIISPISIAAKREYSQKDLLRWAQKYNINLKFPYKMPFISLYSLKFFIAINDIVQQKKFMDRFMSAIWSEQKNGADTSVIKDSAKDVGLDAKKLAKKAISFEVKQKLDANNKKAITKGIFGVPSFVIGKELFFGNDRINFVIEAIKN